MKKIVKKIVVLERNFYSLIDEDKNIIAIIEADKADVTKKVLHAIKDEVVADKVKIYNIKSYDNLGIVGVEVETVEDGESFSREFELSLVAKY